MKTNIREEEKINHKLDGSAELGANPSPANSTTDTDTDPPIHDKPYVFGCITRCNIEI